MSKELKIAIVGSGPAGATAALFLNQKGFDCTVYERVKTPAPVGAGFMLQPTGMLMLQKLGILEKTEKRSTHIIQLYGINENDRNTVNLKFSDIKNIKYSLGLHRGMIFQVLHEELKKHNIPLITGKEITDYKETSDKIIPIDAEGKELGEFDLLVIADGARSKLRDKTGINVKSHWYDWGAMWHIMEDVDSTIGNKIYQRYHNTTQLLGFMPIGYGPDENNQKPLVNLFYSLRLKDFDKMKSTNLDDWKKEVTKLDPIANPFLEQIHSMDDMIFTGYGRFKSEKLVKGRAVLIGDAAHGLSPQLGQGISMALLDAHALAHYLDEKGMKGLEDFSKDRIEHLKYYVWADKYTAPLFQSGYYFDALQRDWGLYLLQKIPFTYQILLQTMIGVKSGLFSKKIDINSKEIYNNI